MASKKYAYYNQGNKIGVVQQDTTDATSTDYGKFKSPVEDVTKGLQVEYAYSPTYTIPEINGMVNTFGIGAWTAVDGYLTFLGSLVDWTTAPQSSAVSVNDYIYSSSAKWRGVHKVQELQSFTGTHGAVKTFTKVSESLQNFTNTGSVWSSATKSIINVDDNLQNSLNPTDHPYIWVSGADAHGVNTGLFSGWSHSTDTNIIDFYNGGLGKYWGHADNSQTLDPSGTTHAFLDDGAHTAYFREARRDFSYIICRVDTMLDESFDIDLNRYQTQAVVFYLKAKYFEDNLDVERYEYYMKKFRETIRRFSSARSHGPYVQQGFWGMR